MKLVGVKIVTSEDHLLLSAESLDQIEGQLVDIQQHTGTTEAMVQFPLEVIQAMIGTAREGRARYALLHDFVSNAVENASEDLASTVGNAFEASMFPEPMLYVSPEEGPRDARLMLRETLEAVPLGATRRQSLTGLMITRKDETTFTIGGIEKTFDETISTLIARLTPASSSPLSL